MNEFEHWTKISPSTEVEKYLIDVIQKLEKELNQYRSYKKPGQRTFDNKDIVHKVFESYLKGYSLAEIANHLNSCRIKTKRGGSTWYKSTIRYMLQNREYVDINYITNDVFNQVQYKLMSNRINSK